LFRTPATEKYCKLVENILKPGVLGISRTTYLNQLQPLGQKEFKTWSGKLAGPSKEK
jgi:hypothetical protein